MRVPLAGLVLLSLLVLPVFVSAQSSNCVTLDSTTCPAGQFRRGGGTLYYPDGTTKVGSLCCTPVCGDGRKEGSERCEKDADCGAGYECKTCSCVQKPPEETQVPAGDTSPSTLEILSKIKGMTSIEQVVQMGEDIADRMYGDNMPALPSPVSSMGPVERQYVRKQCLDSCEKSVKPRQEHCDAMREKMRLFILSIQGLEQDVQSARYREWLDENEFSLRRGCDFSLRGCQSYCFKRIPSLPGEPLPKAPQEKPSPPEEETVSPGPTGPPAPSDVDEETKKALEEAFRGEQKEEKKGVVQRVIDGFKSIFSFFTFGKS